MSGEHYLSEAVLRVMGSGMFRVEGAAWLPPGESKELPIARLKANVLCARHNSALSPLDDVGRAFCAALSDYDAAFASTERFSVVEVRAVEGPDLERWFLKLLCGALAAGTVRTSAVGSGRA